MIYLFYSIFNRVRIVNACRREGHKTVIVNGDSKSMTELFGPHHNMPNTRRGGNRGGGNRGRGSRQGGNRGGGNRSGGNRGGGNRGGGNRGQSRDENGQFE
jgi:hypothetical protein